MSNTITAYFKGRVGVAEAVYQNDYGIVMAFDSIDLPAHFDCYFTVTGSDEAIPGVGADNIVAIPNAVLAKSGKVEIHIPLHAGSNDSEVEYVAYFKVIGRARPEDDGTPAQMTAIERALALLSQPITNIEEIVNEALAFTGETFEEMQEDLDEWKTDTEEGLETWKGGVESDFDNLDAQFQTAVSALTVDSEVQNIRVGDDNVTYTSAGEAVRTQFSNVKSDFGSCVNYGYTQSVRPPIEVGKIASGSDSSSNYYIRNTGYIESSVPFMVVRKVPSSMTIFKYRSDGTYVSALYFADNNDPTKLIDDVDGYKYRFTFTNSPQEDVRNLLDTYRNYIVVLKNESKALSDISARIDGLDSFRLSLSVDKTLMLKNAGSIKTNGTTDSSSYADSMSYSDLVNCYAGDSIKYNLRGYSQRLLIAFYDKSGAFISSPTVEGGAGYMTGEVTVPSGAVYFRISGLATESYYPYESVQYKPTPSVIADILNKIKNIDSIEKHYIESMKAINNTFLIPSKLKFAMHRGARNEAPENTIPAFTIAGQRGAWGIETDIYESTDGVFFCHHDSTVDRMTDGTGNIADMTAAQIEALTIDAGAHVEDYQNLKIPRLTAYLNVCKKYGCVPVIEIKTITNYDNLISLLASCGFIKSMAFLGSLGHVRNVRAHTDEVACMVLVNSETDLSDTFDQAKAIKNIGLAIESTNAELDSDFINSAHEVGMIVDIWTIDASAVAEEWMERGADIITSNSLASL